MDNLSALTVTNIAALITVAGVGVNLIARLARTELKVDTMWADFRRRMPNARADDDYERDHNA